MENSTPIGEWAVSVVSSASSTVSSMADLATAMSKDPGNGSDISVNRIAEALLIQCLTQYANGLEDATSFIAAAQDKQIGRAISAFHADIKKEWSVVDLAVAAAMSRSVFSDRFRELVGVPPMVYVARWRMLKAQNFLLESNMPVSQISEHVGYGSEFAFAKTFKKIIGVAPGDYRRTAND